MSEKCELKNERMAHLLRELQAKPPKRSVNGICHHVRIAHGKLRGSLAPGDDSTNAALWLQNAFQHLDLDVGNYPVPHPSFANWRAFHLAKSTEMWNPKCPYGANRLALLGWLVEVAEGAR
jgi:hypothetical protein